MTSVTEQLEAAVLSLPREERARLAKRLLSSLHDEAEIEDAWREEVKRRLEAYRNAESKTLSEERVMEEARNCAAE